VVECVRALVDADAAELGRPRRADEPLVPVLVDAQQINLAPPLQRYVCGGACTKGLRATARGVSRPKSIGTHTRRAASIPPVKRPFGPPRPPFPHNTYILQL
jgi:hypothetical protein